VLLEGGEFRPLRLGQVLCVAIQDLKRKNDLVETIIQEMKRQPQEIGIKAKLSSFDPFNDLGFFFVIRGHTPFIGKAGGRFNP